ncbi:SWIM zinc finger family protein [Streptomyces sp. MS1.AVA.3]|uniref:SWIM zinc finger family protein n=1 Tax=Streptomyces decoyicus TaxID=249567 RepID=UPI0030BE4D5A
MNIRPAHHAPTEPSFTEDLTRLAGARSFARGQGYLSDVAELSATDDRITATVYGSEPYHVVLLLAGPRLTGSCDCPYGQDGHFCKHCVAVGLTALDRRDDLSRLSAETPRRAQTLDDWLDSLDRDQLRDLLREQLATDPDLHRRLELRAAAAGSDTSAVRAHILRLLDTRPFEQYGVVDRRDAAGYAAQLTEAALAIRALATTELDAEAVTLAETAINAIGEAAERIDDSDGDLSHAAEEMAQVHLEACRRLRPDPVRTAEWLAAHLLGDWSHLPELDPAEYRDILGEPGWAELRRLAHEAHRSHPSGWTERYVLESVLKADGRVDELVTALSTDLEPNGSTHLAIALELDRAGRRDEAVMWAERGLSETETAPPRDRRLIEFLAHHYEDSGRLTDLVRVRRDDFRHHGTLATYRSLRTACRAADCWPAERPRALDLLHATALEEHTGQRPHIAPVLIEALLDDGDTEAAWKMAPSVATTPAQWVRLADAVREQHPAEALPVYLRALTPLKQQTGDPAYERMTELLLSARVCHRALDTEAEFTRYVADLRADQKRKRNLMRMLDEHGL